MIKNQAGQNVQVGLINLDGTDYTGTALVYVTGDGGAPTLGMTGSGVATAQANGPHIYSPSAAETNFGIVTFKFIATGVVSEVSTFEPKNTVGGRPDVNIGSVAGVAVIQNGSGNQLIGGQ